MNQPARQCPNCSALVGADLKMCLTCGQVLTTQSQVPKISSVPGAPPVAPKTPAPVQEGYLPSSPPQQGTPFNRRPAVQTPALDYPPAPERRAPYIPQPGFNPPYPPLPGASTTPPTGYPAQVQVLPDPNQGVPSIQSYGPIHVGTVDFVFDTGQRIRIMGSGLIGRNPSSSDPGVMCTAINDTSISKTHLEYGFDGLGLWIKDRGSTNGSTLVRQGQTTPLQPRAEKQVQVGDVVTIGSRRFVIEGVSR